MRFMKKCKPEKRTIIEHSEGVDRVLNDKRTTNSITILHPYGISDEMVSEIEEFLNLPKWEWYQ